MSIVEAREVENQPEFDPGVVEFGRQLVAWIEADPKQWRGIRTIGDGRYMLSEDPYRTTSTKNALFLIDADRKWVALSQPSDPSMRTPDMIDARDEHFVKFVDDIRVQEERAKVLETQRVRNLEQQKWNEGCTDFVLNRKTEASLFYISTINS